MLAMSRLLSAIVWPPTRRPVAKFGRPATIEEMWWWWRCNEDPQRLVALLASRTCRQHLGQPITARPMKAWSNQVRPTMQLNDQGRPAIPGLGKPLFEPLEIPRTALARHRR